METPSFATKNHAFYKKCGFSKVEVKPAEGAMPRLDGRQTARFRRNNLAQSLQAGSSPILTQTAIGRPVGLETRQIPCFRGIDADSVPKPDNSCSARQRGLIAANRPDRIVRLQWSGLSMVFRATLPDTFF